MQIMVDPQSLKIPSFTFETTSDNTSLHPPSPLQQHSKHKFLSSTVTGSGSAPQAQSLELPSKVSILTSKNQRSMSLSIISQGKTHAIPDEFDLRLSSEHDNHQRQQEKVFKTEAINKGGGKRMKDDGFKCCVFLGMCLPGFGKKAKAVKGRKGGIEMDQYSISMNPVSTVMSSTFSFEINSGVTQSKMVHENNEDDSISSYFELSSTML
ncbi:hypothetical protein SESBI_24088 [Sesbania bispinosa]|nr:hypothetical protein SESBI_24088 [Sesbania bispinosa]